MKETLRIDLGVPKKTSCEKCGEPIDVMEYMGRIQGYKNQMCLGCTINKEKELTRKAELVKVVDFIDRGVKHIRDKIDDMTSHKLKQEIDKLTSQIRFLSEED